MSNVWKSWAIPNERGRGKTALEVTVESNDNVDRGARYILVVDPSLDGQDWLSLSPYQAKALLAILPEVIAEVEK